MFPSFIRSLTNDDNTIRTSSKEIKKPESIKFFKTHKQQTPPIQCHYAISKKYITNISTETTEESQNYSIYLQTNIPTNIFFKVELKNNIYLPVSHAEFSTKSQPLEHIQNQRTKYIQQKKFQIETCPIVHHTDVALSIRTDYTELIINIKFSCPAMEDFISKSP